MNPAKTSLAFDASAPRFTTRGAAWYLGKASITLRKWRVRGIGPAYQIENGRAMYDRADLDRYRESLPKYRSTSERTVAGAAA